MKQMERRQIFDIGKYIRNDDFCTNDVFREQLPIVFADCIRHKFYRSNHDFADWTIDTGNICIADAIGRRHKVSIFSKVLNKDKDGRTVILGCEQFIPNSVFNRGVIISDQSSINRKWMLLLYGHNIYITFNKFSNDVFKGQSDPLVDIADQLDINFDTVVCQYGMPQIQCRKFQTPGFYLITGFEYIGHKYEFVDSVIEYILKSYQPKEEYRIISLDLCKFLCIDDFIDSLNYRRTCVKYFNNRKYVFISPVRNIIRCDFDGYMIDIKVMKYNFGIFESIRNEIHDYIYKLPYMISDLSVYDEILDKVHRWNYMILSFFGNKITKPTFKMRELFKRLRANRYDKINSGFDLDQSYNDAVIIAYIKSRSMLLYDMMISDNKNNRTFIPDYAMMIFKRNQTVENILNEHNAIVGKKLAEITARDEMERISKQKARMVTCSPEYLEYLQYIKFQREYNSYHFQYPEDDELKWHLKNALNEDFTNIEDDPEWKFYNMNMKDLMNGNF